MTKRLAALGLCVIILLSSLPVGFAADEARETISISSLEDFLGFSRECAIEEYSFGKVFSLDVDIDLSGTNFEPIPYFAGTFLGNKHSILNLSYTADGSRMGLFRTIGQEGKVQDIRVFGSVLPSGTRFHIGGIAGENYGTIDNCSFEGSVKGIEFVGGIVGSNHPSGIVSNCSFRGGAVGEHGAGGIAGSNLGGIKNCTNYGKVNPEAIIPEGEMRFDISALSEDDFLNITNIGGIAGSNSGIITASINFGSIGYPNIAYNVGGIAGKSTGYVHLSTNRGDVMGRRDIGGIVGQLIPSAVWDFTDDALKALQGEIGRLNYLLSNAAADSKLHTEEIKGILDNMSAHTDSALDELNSIIAAMRENNGDFLDGLYIDPETGELVVPELPGYVDTSVLTEALMNIEAYASGLVDISSEVISSAANNLTAISSQVSRIFNALSSMLNIMGEPGLFSTYDLSATETYKHDDGAIAGCKNQGSVFAEDNGGGIVGIIAFELEFDMENRLDASSFITSDAKAYLFAAVRDCENYSEITVKRDNAGGIAGSMQLGALANCVGAGRVVSETGSYAGGIAGTATGTVSGCWAHTELLGKSYVGGICGLGDRIVECRAWTHIENAGEYYGAVAGWAEGEILNNLYVEGSPAAIDNVSRIGQARPVSSQEITKLPGAPDIFDDLIVRFVVNGKVIKSYRVPFGGSVTQMPEVERDGDKYWQWEECKLDKIYHSITVTGQYCTPCTVLSTSEELPLFLVEGVFYDGQSLSAAVYTPEEMGDELISAYTLFVNGYEGVLTVRMLAETDGLLQTSSAKNQFSPTQYTRDGKYIVFTMENGNSLLYSTAEKALNPLPIVLINTGAAALLLFAAIVLIRRKKKKKKDAADETEKPEE